MKLRIILLVLSLLAFLSASTGGYLYYSSLKKSAFKEAERQAVARVHAIKKNLSFFLSENIKPVKALAGMEETRQALAQPDNKNTLDNANIILDHFNDALNVEVCYLMDPAGNTIASSNRNAPDSFVGNNFDFRPYFQQAIMGKPSTYLALGTASGRRGAYFSHPIFISEKKNPIGIAVIKASIEQIEKELVTGQDEIVLVTDPHGIVFISNRKSLLYHSLTQLSSEQLSQINQSLQFGQGPWNWTGFKPNDNGYVADGAGNEFMLHQTELDNYPEWKVVYLRNLQAISKTVLDPLIKISGPLILTLCLMIGFSVFLLYRKASVEIFKRQSAEEALELAKEELRRYSEDLERLVKKQTQEITSILRYTPAIVSIKDRDGRYVLVNSRFEELFAMHNETVRGKTDYDIFPADIADQFRHNDLKVLSQGSSYQVEEHIPLREGDHTYLSVKFPVYEDSDTPSGVCGISTDITAVKKAQNQLRRLSGSIMTSQEKERSAIARELHDELGQMLTALRMDSAWLQERLRKSDPESAARAKTMDRLIDKTIQDVRSMAFRLRPGVLDDLGLVEALEWYTSDFERRTGITCIFEHNRVSDTNDTVATASYRITQEALTNVARHAFASHVDVVLKQNREMLTLLVSDNGCGFDTLELSESEGLGVAGMRERASLAGGDLEIQSQPDRGTRVYFKVPVQWQHL